MISHKYRCIFIHIPKCAGTSIEKALGHFADYHGISRQDHRSIRMIEPINLKSFSTIQNSKEFTKRLLAKINPPPNPRSRRSVTREQYQDYFKFTIVRNPWSRAYSWYKNTVNNKEYRKAYKITEGISFYDYLTLLSGNDSLRPQTFWLKNFKGDIPLDYIGRFETLTNDFEEICHHLGVAPIKLPHELKRDVDTYQNNYDEKSKALIEKVFQEEIELFGYSFNS